MGLADIKTGPVTKKYLDNYDKWFPPKKKKRVKVKVKLDKSKKRISYY